MATEEKFRTHINERGSNCFRPVNKELGARLIINLEKLYLSIKKHS